MNAIMRSFAMGMLPGAVSRAQFPQAQKEPVAYLYGQVAKEGETPTHTIDGVGYVGAVLPKLPEWDREAYPYAVIFQRGGHGLRCASKPWVWTGLMFDSDGKAIEAYCSMSADVWGEFEKLSTADRVSGFFWTNHDILNSDGTVYLAASAPIPVYE